MEQKYSASFEIKEVAADNLAEFIDNVKSISSEGREVSNIVAIVVTTKLL